MRALPRTLAAALASSLALGLAAATGPSAPALAAPSATATPATSATSVADGNRVATRRTARRSAARQIDLTRWDTDAQWRSGRSSGTKVSGGRLWFSSSQKSRTFGGRTYEMAGWMSPWTAPGLSYTELIASWSALTPRDSWVEIQVRGRAAGSRATSWDVLSRWSRNDRFLKRHSVSGQGDDGTTVNVDTWTTPGLASYQLRVRLMRRAGTGARPSVDLASVMTSRLPATAGPTSRPGPARGKVLDVPRYSQMTHAGHYPRWGGGGEAWCSPTSTSMVLGYYDALPRPRSYRWVGGGHTDPWVDHAARLTYDHAYDGTGNWPFNTAYAAPMVGKGFVTRLRNLREAERFIAAGIPLVVSIAFDRGELAGAPIGSSNGHLLVVAGFRKNGRVVVNDPAASERAKVRRTYRRDQFEKIWLEASGGLAYVLHDQAHPLPKGRFSNW